MRTLLRFIFLLSAVMLSGHQAVWAQTVPTLEFAAGPRGNPNLNPTGNGPTVNNQVITFQTNSNNPTDNTLATSVPLTTATLSLSNQQFKQPTTKIVTGTGVAFGANLNATGQLAGELALFPPLSLIGGSSNANYTSAVGGTGGIDVGFNRGTEIFVSTEPLPASVPANARYRYADLTITFNRSVANPIIHVTGLGGSFGGGIGFTSELDLVSADLGATAVTLSKLDGSVELNVTPTQILNSAAAPDGTTGAGAASGSVLVNTPNGGGVTSLVFRIYLRPNVSGGAVHTTDNSRHTADGWIISVSSLASISPITGTVYEDVNYGGGAGRPRTVAGAAVRPNARVELYDSNGAFVSSTTTNASGQYAFTPGSGDYTVRVVNSTVTSSRPGAIAALLPVQTYNNETNYVGGEDPTKTDASNGSTNTNLANLNTATTIAQSQAPVTVAVGTTAVTADFGFNFSTVVNTNNSGQGSLRQFILNSNALTNDGLDQDPFNGTPATGTTAIDPAPGMEYAIFMLNNGQATALPGLRATTASAGYDVNTKAFTFSGLAALPTITDSNTAIDGKLQTVLTGEGTTPTAANLAGEIILDFSTSNRGGISVTGGNTRIASLNITGAGNLGGGTNGSRALNTTGAVISDGVAIVFTSDATAGSIVTDVTGFNNTIATVLLANGATNVTLSNNSFRTGRSVAATGSTTIAYDGAGILLSNASDNTIQNNNISNNSGFGIELMAGSNRNVISGNIVSTNGLASTATADDAGISITLGNDNVISNNTISNNIGDGIVVLTGTSGNRFSQNSIFGNGNLGVDLSVNNSALGDGITLNASNKTAASGANGLLNFPVITQAAVTNATNGNLVISGFAPTGSTIELFISDKSAPGFGQGKTYLLTLLEGGTVGGVADVDSKTSSYSGLINDLDQGSETNASRFYFTIPLSALTAGQRTALTSNTARLTATATRAQATSEFSGNVLVKQNSPLPVTLVAFGAQAAGLNARLNWKTAQELNNDHFVVERSFDGRGFVAVGEVKGQGSTQSATSYAFTDERVANLAPAGLVYYRLRQVDADGTEALSEVQAVRFPLTARTLIDVYPNPATTIQDAKLDLSSAPAGSYQVTLVDMTGRVLRSFSQNGGTVQQLQLTSLPTGTYLVRVQGNGQSFSRRVIKE